MSQTQDPQEPLAKLFIPSESKIALVWRLKLIEAHKVFDIEVLGTLLKKVSKTSTEHISSEEKKIVLNAVLAESLAIDEYDQAVLFVTKCLLNIEHMPDKTVMQFDKTSRILQQVGKVPLEDFILSNKSHFEFVRINLKNYSAQLLKHELGKLRAALAFKEIAALFCPDEMIPVLVSISPKYLASNFTQKWLLKQQYYAKFGSKPEQTKARKLLSVLTKAISGDQRSIRKRNYDYWKLALRYEDLSGHIKGFREQVKSRQLDKQYFEMYCEDRGIAKEYGDLILGSKTPSKELALEIMTDQGLIKEPKAFRDIQPFINRIQKKHFGGNVLSIASEAMPIVVEFLDLPNKDPGLIFRADLTEVLERVRL